MAYVTAELASALRAAREAKGLTQRQLSELVKLPQGHISKIESGAVDLRVSSLIELSRALDLELTLVPRNSVPAVQSIVRSAGMTPSAATTAATPLKIWAVLKSRLVELTRVFPDSLELAKLGRLFRDLQRLPLTNDDRKTLSDALAELVRVLRTRNLAPLEVVLDQLQQLRNDIAHRPPRTPATDEVRPAYSLEDDRHD